MLCGIFPVSGLSCTPPNGTHAPGKVWPIPPVPIIGFTYEDGFCAETAAPEMMIARIVAVSFFIGRSLLY